MTRRLQTPLSIEIFAIDLDPVAEIDPQVLRRRRDYKFGALPICLESSGLHSRVTGPGLLRDHRLHVASGRASLSLP